MFRLLLKSLLLTSLCYIPLGSVSQANTSLAGQDNITLVKYKQEYSQLPESTKLWYKELHNSRGQWCCDESDGEAYYGNYYLLPDGGVRLGDGTSIPSEQVVLDKGNPTGHAVWFHNAYNTYCFVPGALN